MPDITIFKHGDLLNTYSIFDKSGIGVGRHFSNDISLPDQENKVSRFHAAIFCGSDAGFIYQDLGSKNGTRFNGKKQAYGTLHDGDKLEIGDFQLVFSDSRTDQKKTFSAIKLLNDKKDRGKFRLPKTETVFPQITEEPHTLLQFPGDLQLLYRLVRSTNNNLGIEENLHLYGKELFKRFSASSVIIGLLDTISNEPLHLIQVPDNEEDFLLSSTVLEEIKRNTHAICKQSLIFGIEGQETITMSLGLWDQIQGFIQLRRESDLSFHEKVLLQNIAADLSLFLNNYFYISALSDERTLLENRLFDDKVMVGVSSYKKRIQEFISEISATDDTVLITGESGTGKDLAAELIHMQSRRNKKPFVIVNCSAIPEGLLESEMFGYKRGAHGTAHSDFRGKFEMAHMGTIFLNEIGEMSNILQAKLLDVIERKVVWPLGSEQPKAVDVRIIAATNKNLKEAMKEGKFRKDLYQRLNIQTLNLLPLRERREDIPILAGYFLCKERDAHVKRIEGFSNRCMEMMMRYSWPGNVRELSHTIKRAATRCKKTSIAFHDLGIDQDDDEPLRTLEEMEKEHIRHVLEVAGSKEEAARILGIVKQTLYEKGRKYHLPGFQKHESNERNGKTNLT